MRGQELLRVTSHFHSRFLQPLPPGPFGHKILCRSCRNFIRNIADTYITVNFTNFDADYCPVFKQMIVYSAHDTTAQANNHAGRLNTRLRRGESFLPLYDLWIDLMTPASLAASTVGLKGSVSTCSVKLPCTG